MDFGLAYQAYAKKPDLGQSTWRRNTVTPSLQHEVEIEGPPKNPRSDITVKVTYKFPFNVPGIGRIIGKRNIRRHVLSRYYFGRNSLPNEGPQNDDKTTGIGYGKF